MGEVIQEERWESLCRRDTEDISYVSLEVPCCKKHSTLIWKSARLEGKALSAVSGKRSSAVSQQKIVRIKPVQTEVILTAEVDKVAMGTNVFAGSKA